MSASARSRVATSNAGSKSLGVRTSGRSNRRRNDWAAVSMLFIAGPCCAAFQSTATRDTLGETSLINSSRFVPKSGERFVNPVMFPPGRARLVTNPCAMGSPTFAMTIGMSLVACWTARIAGVDAVTMTSTFRPTNSTANSASRSKRSLNILGTLYI